MPQMVLIRHGESQWNLENRFTGWIDVPLTPKGEQEAREAGQKIQAIRFDEAFTSVLTRAKETLRIVLEVMGQTNIPVEEDQALNERKYGDLQGLNKAETAAKHGEDQVKVWRRSYATRPPELTSDDERYPGHDPRYAGLSADELPSSECLKDTVERMLPYWHDTIAPDVLAGRRVLIAAHGNSLRALVKHLDDVSDDEIVGLNIPTGIPLVYELNDDLTPIKSFYLGDAEAVAAAQAAVAAQGQVKRG